MCLMRGQSTVTTTNRYGLTVQDSARKSACTASIRMLTFFVKLTLQDTSSGIQHDPHFDCSVGVAKASWTMVRAFSDEVTELEKVGTLGLDLLW